MTRDREGTWPKIIRAEEHLASIKAEVDLYAEGDPYKLLPDFDAEGRHCTIRAVVHEQPSVRLSVLIGEFIYNLRSALDHLMEWLVQRGGRPCEAQFPIRDSCLNRNGTPTPLKFVDRVSARAAAVIESVQPYHRPDNAGWHPLSMLGHLSNADKHRNLLVTATLAVNTRVMVTIGSSAFAGVALGQYEHGAPVLDFTLDTPVSRAEQAEVKVNGDGRVLVTFAEDAPPGHAPLQEVLPHILRFVRDGVVRPVERAELLPDGLPVPAVFDSRGVVRSGDT